MRPMTARRAVPDGGEAPRGPVVESRCRILYRDVDRMGVVYYARYLELFEMGRTEWARAHGIRYRDVEDVHQRVMPVVEARCRYLASLEFDEVALVRTWVAAWTGSTIRYGYQVLAEEAGRLCAVGEAELACVRRDDLRPTRLPEPFLTVLAEVVPEARGRRRG